MCQCGGRVLHGRGHPALRRHIHSRHRFKSQAIKLDQERRQNLVEPHYQALQRNAHPEPGGRPDPGEQPVAPLPWTRFYSPKFLDSGWTQLAINQGLQVESPKLSRGCAAIGGKNPTQHAQQIDALKQTSCRIVFVGRACNRVVILLSYYIVVVLLSYYIVAVLLSYYIVVLLLS